MRQQAVFWGCTVPKPLDDAVNQVLDNSTLKTRSEFIRDCVRRRLEGLGYLPSFSPKGNNK